MVSFSMTGLLLHVALFPSGTTHDCAIGQAGPSIWSRLPASHPYRGAHATDRVRGSSRSQYPSCAARRRGAVGVQETQEWGRALSVAIAPVGVHDRASLEAAFATLRRGSPDALMTTADAVLASYRSLIVEFARERRLISMYGDREYVVDGGLMFYGTSFTDMWRHGATYVDRILKGTKPGDLPVQQPTKFELVINLKTAKTLGLTIPQSLLLRADQVIQ